MGNNYEHIVQKSIKEYLDARNICWWAVPNGGNRNTITAKILKSEGVKAGVPDITIIFEGMYYGLEVKKPKTNTPKGRLSNNQKEVIKQIKKAGGDVAVVYSVSDVIEQLINWGINVQNNTKR